MAPNFSMVTLSVLAKGIGTLSVLKVVYWLYNPQLVSLSSGFSRRICRRYLTKPSTSPRRSSALRNRLFVALRLVKPWRFKKPYSHPRLALNFSSFLRIAFSSTAWSVGFSLRSRSSFATIVFIHSMICFVLTLRRLRLSN